MAGYLICEQGPLKGTTLCFEEGNEWSLGRDPDQVSHVLEDPSVSRKHIQIRLTDEGYLIENVSEMNPATKNGEALTEATLLQEGDEIHVGGSVFRFSNQAPEEPPEVFEEVEEFGGLGLPLSSQTRWLIKVISGPNAGAEFNLPSNQAQIIGKDPNSCDIIFQDLSVSRQHARITIDQSGNEVKIEDLRSRNGVIVNGELIENTKPLSSQDLIALGTTSFLIIDREETRETIISPPQTAYAAPEKKEEEKPIEKEEDWKEMVIPKKHLIIAGTFIAVIVALFFGMFSLLKTEPVEIVRVDRGKDLEKVIDNYPGVEYTFNGTNGRLFLVGNILSSVRKEELFFELDKLSFIEGVDDNVIIDELVWQNMNAMLATNPAWVGISIHSPMPGMYVMNGYLETLEQLQELNDYVNLNFPYLDRLRNLVVVETNLIAQVQGMLIARNFNNITFQLSNGELVLLGRVDERQGREFLATVQEFREIHGIRTVHNFVIITSEDTSRVDLTSEFQVQGTASQDSENFFVMINGSIYGEGAMLSDMMITSITANEILLEKDGLKFKINYNPK